MEKTAHQPVKELATNRTPSLIANRPKSTLYHRPRNIWKGRIWKALKPYQQMQILRQIADQKAVIW